MISEVMASWSGDAHAVWTSTPSGWWTVSSSYCIDGTEMLSTVSVVCVQFADERDIGWITSSHPRITCSAAKHRH